MLPGATARLGVRGTVLSRAAKAAIVTTFAGFSTRISVPISYLACPLFPGYEQALGHQGAKRLVHALMREIQPSQQTFQFKRSHALLEKI